MALPIVWSIDSILGNGPAPPPVSGAVPAIAQFHDYLYAVYAPTGSTAAALSQLTFGPAGNDAHGNVWAGNDPISFGSGGSAPLTLSGPALAVLDGVLYMAYVNQAPSVPNPNLCLAAMQYTRGVQQPLPPTAWTNLRFASSGTQPWVTPGGLAMVAYPWNGVHSLWVFYNFGGVLYYAILQPNPTAGSFAVVVAEQVGSKAIGLSGAPAVAILTDTNPDTLTSYSAPFVVYRDSGSSDLYFVYWDTNANPIGFAGAKAISISSSKKFISDTRTPKAGSNPCLVGFPRIGNLPGIGVLLFQGDSGTSIDVALSMNKDWYVNWAIDTITGHLGNEINPTTSIGCGASLYKGTKLMMIYPGGDPPVKGELYYALFELAFHSGS